ncbi:uncharacterized protein LOC144477707, partial [Augochlora pura]
MSACDIHYRFSIGLMRILGLWPYMSATIRGIQIVLVNFMCCLIGIVQITPFIGSDIDIVLLLQSLSAVIMVAGSVIRQVMESVKEMWTTTHKDTLEILERRAVLGKQQGAIYA